MSIDITLEKMGTELEKIEQSEADIKAKTKEAVIPVQSKIALRTEPETDAAEEESETQTQRDTLVESSTLETSMHAKGSEIIDDAGATEIQKEGKEDKKENDEVNTPMEDGNDEVDLDSSKEYTGKVVKWIPTRGYGFIHIEGGEHDYFFHASDILPITRNSMNHGENVNFYLAKTTYGKARAIKVRGDGTGKKVLLHESSNNKGPRNKRWMEHQRNEVYKHDNNKRNGIRNYNNRNSFEGNKGGRRNQNYRGYHQNHSHHPRKMYVEVTPGQMSLWQAFCNANPEMHTANTVYDHPPGNALVYKCPNSQAPLPLPPRTENYEAMPAMMSYQQPPQNIIPAPAPIIPSVSTGSSLLSAGQSPSLLNFRDSTEVHNMVSLLQQLTAAQNASSKNDMNMDIANVLEGPENHFRSSYDEYGSGYYPSMEYNQHMSQSIPDPAFFNDIPTPRNTSNTSTSGWDNYSGQM